MYVKVAGALTSCDHQKSKLRAVVGVEGLWVAELRVQQLKIGSKSCFGNYELYLAKLIHILPAIQFAQILNKRDKMENINLFV